MKAMLKKKNVFFGLIVLLIVALWTPSVVYAGNESMWGSGGGGWYSTEYVADLLYRNFHNSFKTKAQALDVVNREYVEVWNISYGVYHGVVKSLNELQYTSYGWDGEGAFIRAVADNEAALLNVIKTRGGVKTVKPTSTVDNSGLVDIEGYRTALYSDGDNYYARNLDSSTGKKSGGASKFEKAIADLFTALGEQLASLLEFCGMNLDTAVFGRVNGNGVLIGGYQVAPYTFELETNNPYGKPAAVLYSIIRNYAYLFMAFATFIQLLRLSFTRGRQGFEALAVVFKNIALSLIMIFAMPYMFEVACLARDALLSSIVNGARSALGFGNTGIVDIFHSLAINSDTQGILNSLLYLAAVCLNVVYTFIYIGIALEMMIYFITFPVVCVKGATDFAQFKGWATRVISLLIIPIVDGVMFLVPAGICSLGAAHPRARLTYSFIAFACLALQTAVRKTFFEALGLQAGSVGDAAAALGMATAATMAGASKKVVSLGRTAVATGVDIAHKGNEARAYGKMARAEKANGGGSAPKEKITESASNNSSAPTFKDAPGGAPGQTLEGVPTGSPAIATAAAVASTMATSALGGRSYKPFKDYGSTDNFANVLNYKNKDVWDGLSNKQKQKMLHRDMWLSGLKGVGGLAGGLAGVGFGGLAGIGMGAAFGAGGISSLGVAGAEIAGDIGEGVGKAVGAAAYGYFSLFASDEDEVTASSKDKQTSGSGAPVPPDDGSKDKHTRHQKKHGTTAPELNDSSDGTPHIDGEVLGQEVSSSLEARFNGDIEPSDGAFDKQQAPLEGAIKHLIDAFNSGNKVPDGIMDQAFTKAICQNIIQSFNGADGSTNLVSRSAYGEAGISHVRDTVETRISRLPEIQKRAAYDPDGANAFVDRCLAHFDDVAEGIDREWLGKEIYLRANAPDLPQ